MKQQQHWRLLHLFGAESEGANMSDPALQTTTGETDTESAPVAGESDRTSERQKEFRALMEGEYKDLFTAYFQETFNRRFKEQKEMKEELERARGTLAALCTELGVEKDHLPETVRRIRELAATAQAAPPEKENTPTQSEICRQVEQAVEAARLETEQRLLEGIRARGLRPSESALTVGEGDALRGRANGLSRAQRADMARRAARGEHIKL